MFNFSSNSQSAPHVLALTHSAGIAAQIEKAFRRGPLELRVQMRINGTGIETYLSETSANIVLLDLDLSHSSSVDELRNFVNTNAHRIAILVTSPTSTLQNIRSLIKMGIVDFIPQPIEESDLEEGLAAALLHLEDFEKPAHEPGGRIVTFMRASGGAGATTLLAEAAASIAQQSLTNPAPSASPSASLSPFSVAAIDFDIQFGNLAHNLDLTPRAGLINILEAPDRLDQEYLQSSMTRHESGIDILSAPDPFVPLDALTPDIVRAVLLEAKHRYVSTFVDMPLTWTDWTQPVLAASDIVVLVTQPGVPSIRRTRRLLNVFREMELDDLTLLLVCNQISKSIGGRARQREASQAINQEINYCIRFDQQTACEAADRGTFYHQVNEKSVAAKDIAKFVEGLERQLNLETAHDGRFAPRPSWFRRQTRPSV